MNYIRVLGEGDEHDICRITLDADDDAQGGIQAASLKVLICTHPDVEALFPGGLQPSTMQLRMHGGERLVLRDATRVRAGQTVHLCSAKGDVVAEFAEETDDATPVYYGDQGLYVLVPKGKQFTWACDELGLSRHEHCVMRLKGRLTLMKEETRQPAAAAVPIQNDNNGKKPEDFFSKWKEEHEAIIELLDGSTYCMNIKDGGETLVDTLECLEWLFKIDASSHVLHYCNAPIAPVRVYSGMKYKLLKKP